MTTQIFTKKDDAIIYLESCEQPLHLFAENIYKHSGAKLFRINSWENIYKISLKK